MSNGTVFDIQRFCIDDGPGIRTTVFLKGCPLRCIWCHNAEGLSKKIQLYYTADRCVRCGRCVSVCPVGAHSFSSEGEHNIDFSKCTACGACVKVCPSEALRIAGKIWEADEVIDEVMKDLPFYKTSNGGMTLSGGEPLMQKEFALELVRKAKERGLHVCIETSGYCDEDTMLSVAQYIDIFLFDFKHYSNEKHLSYTGVENIKIRKNLELLSSLNKSVILRCPIIPTCNDNEAHYTAIAELANKMKNILEIHIEPYHSFGVSKYASIGIKPKYEREKMMTKEDAETIAEFIRALTDTPVIIS